MHAQPEAAEQPEASEAEDADHGEEMEAALAALGANAQKKLEEPHEPGEKAETSAAEAFVAGSSASEDSAEKSEKTADKVASTEAEPELPNFLNDRELVPADEADEPAETKHAAKAEAFEPSQAHSEDSAQVEAPTPAVTGALAAAATKGGGGGRWRCYSIRSSYCFFGYVLGSGPERTQRVAHCRRRAGYPHLPAGEPAGSF